MHSQEVVFSRLSQSYVSPGSGLTSNPIADPWMDGLESAPAPELKPEQESAHGQVQHLGDKIERGKGERQQQGPAVGMGQQQEWG